MIAKAKEKELAIKLRKQGLSYNQVLKQVPVAKSTLSLWLREVGLSKEQKQSLSKKSQAARLKGAQARKTEKLKITKQIKDKARQEIGALRKRDLWLIGTALYWGEGDKEKEKSCLVRLGNSDPRVIKIFLKWLYQVLGVEKNDIFFRICLHEKEKKRINQVKKYWAEVTEFSEKDFQSITWKKHKIKSKRKNTGKPYYGLLIVGVRKSTDLNRRIQGWIEGLN